MGNVTMSRTQEKISQPSAHVYAGIDVGKDTLDFYIHPTKLRKRVDNNKKGVTQLIQLCIRHKVNLIALEATSKYHRRTHEMMHSAGLCVAVINPFRSRKFADSLGKLAKTDTIDAAVLARFAELMQPDPTIPPNENHKALRELLTARRQALEEIGDLKRHLHTAQHPLVTRQIHVRIKMAERHKAKIEAEIETLIATDPALKNRFDILKSIPNIGSLTAAMLVADLSELGRVNAKQIAALAGVAPMSWDSGQSHGKRMIRGGRKAVRNALYMCAVGCASRDGAMGQFYRRLIKLGKHPKTALTAVMRKLVILANTLIAENRHWEPAPHF